MSQLSSQTQRTQEDQCAENTALGNRVVLESKVLKNPTIKSTDFEHNTAENSSSENSAEVISTEALSAIQLQKLREILECGLPHVAQPYLTIAKQILATEAQVLAQISAWQTDGLIKRFGLVVKHRQLGYKANAMVVWDIPADKVDEVGELLSLCDAVTLCYQRPRQLPEWSYNLFSMIHGQDRDTVLQQLAEIVEQNGLTGFKRDVLFSYKLFKQCGGQYVQPGCTNELAKGIAL